MNHRPTLHGAAARGLYTNPQSTSFEGMFGRMFRTIPSANHSDDDLAALARAMVAPPEPEQTPESKIDDEENQGIDAGYTYLGQFIDHDLTFDPSSSLQKQNDPNGIIDFRTPRFDLDNIYGRGPDDQPYLYKRDGRKMLLGRKLKGAGNNENARDLPRQNLENTTDTEMSRIALIGDPRNDENVIVSQLQGIFLRFHNRMADLMPRATFQEVQQQVRWHYQWMVLHDFLPKIVGNGIVKNILPHLEDEKKFSILDKKPQLKFYHHKNDIFIPVEFSVAAYRFGHSMVRPIYRLNQTLEGRFMIFGRKPNEETLVGFREFPEEWAIDWDLFFNSGNNLNTDKRRTQKSYKIDSSLVDPLGHLPPSIAGMHGIKSLSERNLLRGRSMGLPSGQDVARFMGIEPIEDRDLKIGKGTEANSKKNKSILEISANFKDNAPLWCYILAEAQNTSFKNDDDATFTLGPVGGTIVAEVFIGLLLGDSHSYLSLFPKWKPLKKITKNGKFGMRELIDAALQAEE